MSFLTLAGGLNIATQDGFSPDACNDLVLELSCLWYRLAYCAAAC